MKAQFVRFSLITSSLLVLSACQSIPVGQVNHRILAWQGQSIDQVFKYWGLPTRQSEADGKQYAEWVNVSHQDGNTAISIGTGTRGRHSALGIGLTLFDLGSSEDECSRLVSYDAQGIVQSIRWQGDHDFCYEITPPLPTTTSTTNPAQP